MNTYSNHIQAEFKRRLSLFTQQGKNISEREEAILFAQAVEIQFLKTPDTAVFSSPEQFKVSKNKKTYKVSGYVYSENSTGIFVKTRFKVNINKKDGLWHCTDSCIASNTKTAKTLLKHAILYFIISIVGIIAAYFIIRHFLKL